MMRITPALFSLFIAAFSLQAFAADQPSATLAPEHNRITVRLAGEPFTDYYFGATEKHPYVRPYLFPVRAADGTPVTSDQIDVPKGDHPHHRSLWVAHGDVNGANHWTVAKAGYQPKQRHAGFEKVEGDTLVEDLEWEGTDGQPIMKERRTVRFFAFADRNRGIDFTLEFAPIAGDVKLADTKEAGLCSVRLSNAISQHATITLSTGATATGDAKNDKEEAAVWGKAADWCDESGMIDGKPYGVAILDHPANPRHPSRWMVRLYGLMTANIFGLHDYDKTQSKGAGDFTIPAGQSVTFRYRVVVHTGDATKAKLTEKYAEYAK